MPISGSQARDTPNFTSADVIGVPSSKRTPSFRVNVQLRPSSEGVPRSVARSGTTADGSSELPGAGVVSVR